MQPNNLLFSARLDMQPDAQSQTTNKTNNDLFLIFHKIISELTDIIYKALLKDVYGTVRSKDSLFVEFKFTKGVILLSVFFNPSETLDNTDQEIAIAHEILFAAAEIFIIESYAHNFLYCHIPHMNVSHTWNAKSTHPVIKVKHKSSIELLNKLEPLINKMYSIDENIEINIHINGKNFPFLPIKKSRISKSSRLSRIPEIIDGIVIPGPPKNGQDTFQFKQIGSNKLWFLENSNKTRNDFLARKARYEDKVRLSVFHTYKTNRGIEERTNKLYLHEIIRNYEKGQLPLIAE